MVGLLLSQMKELCAAVRGKMQADRGRRRMELVETLHLGSKRQLMLVVCDGQAYLIGASGDSVQAIEPVSRMIVTADGSCSLRTDHSVSASVRIVQ
jgi:flagellar biogenesis protein FliO